MFAVQQRKLSVRKLVGPCCPGAAGLPSEVDSIARGSSE